MRPHVYNGLWWSMRLYVLGFAGFIVAFGAYRWRLPDDRRLYEAIGRGDVSKPHDASGADPNDRASYRPDVCRSRCRAPCAPGASPWRSSW